MKKIIFFLLIGTLSFSFSGTWNSPYDYFKEGLNDVRQKGFFPDWAGRVVALYFNDDGTFGNRARIQITWKTDDANVQCGDILELNTNEFVDFNFRSLAMKKCY